jgi:hypothetical protein
MLRKLIVLAITSGLAAKLYRKYAAKQASADTAPTAPATTRRRAGTAANQG